MQCDAQDAERRTFLAALVQPPFKFCSPAYRSGIKFWSKLAILVRSNNYWAIYIERTFPANVNI